MGRRIINLLSRHRRNDRQKAPGDLRVEISKKAVISIGLVRLSPRQWPKVNRRAAK